MGSLVIGRKKLIYRIIFFLMIAGLAMFVLRIFQQLPNELQLSYDLHRYGPGKVGALHVAIKHKGKTIQSTSFLLKEGRPLKFRHQPRLVKGLYKLVLTVIELKGRRKTTIQALRSPQKGVRIFHLGPD